MNTENEPRVGLEHNKSFLRKGQFIGASIGMLFTVGIVLISFIVPRGGRQGYPDFPGFLLFLSFTPTSKLANVNLSWFFNDARTAFRIGPVCLAIFVNSIIGFAVGSVMGLLIRSVAANKKLL